MWRFKNSKETGVGPGLASPYLTTLNDFCGRQVWDFDPALGSQAEKEAVEKARAFFWSNRHEKKHSSDMLLRLQAAKDRPLPPVCKEPAVREKNTKDTGVPVPKAVVENSLLRACGFYSTLQCDSGHFPGDYGGPMFLMPGLVIVLYISGALRQVLSEHHIREMRRYLFAHQNRDGGWGLHIEGHSTMFGSVLSYVTLRLLGVGPDDDCKEFGPSDSDEPAMTRGRAWINSKGGAAGITSWGKFWLAVLGVYEWVGINPMPPEMWLLPYFIPLHPGRFWCHCRMVYLPMSYVYGRRGTGAPTALTQALRSELYPEPYASINWNSTRNRCAKEDLYYSHPLIQDMVWAALHWGVEPLLQRWPLNKLRQSALAHVMEHIHYEDESTRYVDIGPVNKVINMLCCWLEDPQGEAFKRHLPRVKDYLWLAEDGMKMQGYNGSQLWDTAFAVQAVAASGMMEEPMTAILSNASKYIDKAQVRENSPGDMNYFYRHISKGAWPFSNRDHGWPISDCSSEGLKAALVLAGLPEELVGPHLPDDRLFDAINIIMSYQNKDGGFATYENTRSFAWIEAFNPSETFGDIMIDYSCVECTSACVTAMSAFRRQYPHHREDEVGRAISRARDFILSIQRSDGSWYGSWGVCFTYAGWFGIGALLASGLTYETSPAIRKAVAFLLSKQLPNGGWGESYLSCQDKVYTHLEGGKAHAVNTAWAMLALLEAGEATRHPQSLHAGARVLLAMQEESGDWPQQAIMGVFNRNCMITYANYRNIFPIWALGLYKKAFGL
eukprot:jgi/Mesvir1/8394/Mv12638-RA.1